MDVSPLHYRRSLADREVLGMKGVKFVIDENGEQSAVLIDLKENAELWEDFYDAYVACEREGEPRESLEEVRQKLQAQGKVSRA